MLIGAPSPCSCCAASWAIHGSRKSDIFRPEEPARVDRVNRERRMRFRLFGLIAAACLAFAGAANAQGKIQLQWFAQSAFKLTTQNGHVIMIDPWLTGNPMTPPEWKDLDKLGKVDVILVTHAHG